MVATLVHIPREPGSAHDRQGPEQAPSQQVPCAQKVLWHSAPLAHNAPLIFKPQEFVLGLQMLGGEHCWSLTQAAKHFPPLQANGKQGRESGATHWPIALHVDGGV